jgi:C4-dicarboxylate transporter DctM subunit
VSSHIVVEEGPLNKWHHVENLISVTILVLMVGLTVLSASWRELMDILVDVFKWETLFSAPTDGGDVGGIRRLIQEADILFAGANSWVQALNLWLTFTGGALAARASSHLALSTGSLLNLQGKAKHALQGFTAAVATAVTAMLAYASLNLVLAETESALRLVGGVPMWVFQTAMPIGFLVMAFRLAWRGNDTREGRITALVAVLLACALALVPPGFRGLVVWGSSFILLFSIILGAPLFTAMGGMAMLLFYGADLPLAAVPSETFRIVSNPMLAALPMFTLAGYLLAEGGASRRIVDLFQAFFGWLPGGVAAAAVLACAFFTTFTGASGVTILALGGVLLPVLLAAGYSEKYAVGLLTASGSIGLLFPPSLPVILYGVAAHMNPVDLYIGGFIPGVILVSLVVGMSFITTLRKHGISHWLHSEEKTSIRVQRRVTKMCKSLWIAKFEAFLPVLILVGIFGGFLTIFEAAAFTAFYAFLIEVVIHKDLHIKNDVPRVFVETARLMGGVLIILGVAFGFTSYLVDAEVPLMVRDWVSANVGNKIIFIALLNILLLVVGCLMDIYSAIMVVVPLIAPVALIFGIHPVHLGVLFLANLELGYLTPPVGLNLFLSSFRFKIPLTQVYRYTLPFLGLMAFGVLFIAYVPIATTWGVGPAPTEQHLDIFEKMADPDDPNDTRPSAAEMLNMLD